MCTHRSYSFLPPPPPFLIFHIVISFNAIFFVVADLFCFGRLFIGFSNCLLLLNNLLRLLFFPEQKYLSKCVRASERNWERIKWKTNKMGKGKNIEPIRKHIGMRFSHFRLMIIWFSHLLLWIESIEAKSRRYLSLRV